MSVLVNFKICDNAKECGGIAICPTGALSLDEEQETIRIDNDKCISCGQCENECPIGAIRVAATDEEYSVLQKEIDEDLRTTKDLFVDRYGAAPISPFFMLDAKEVEQKVKHKGITLIEFYNDDSIQCLLKSIPMKELTKDFPEDTLFYKVEATEEVIQKYAICAFPSLFVYRDGKLLGHIDGYFTVEEENTFLAQLNQIVK